jgi:hypothetical protein
MRSLVALGAFVALASGFVVPDIFGWNTPAADGDAHILPAHEDPHSLFDIPWDQLHSPEDSDHDFHSETRVFFPSWANGEPTEDGHPPHRDCHPPKVDFSNKTIYEILEGSKLCVAITSSLLPPISN